MCFIKEIAKAVEKEYPLERAERSWDNVGVLIELGTIDRKALLCIDLTMEVVEECINKEIHSVIAYHPVIFTPIKQITSAHPVIHRCVCAGISVYSPHTSLDGGNNGINAWLGCLIENANLVRTVGFMQVFSNVKSIGDILHTLSVSLGLKCVRYSLGYGHNMESIPKHFMVSAGAGTRSLKKVISSEERESTELVSLGVVGEASHHDILLLNRLGVSLIILEHSRSERGFLVKIKELLEKEVQGSFIISEKDKDPVDFFIRK